MDAASQDPSARLPRPLPPSVEPPPIPVEDPLTRDAELGSPAARIFREALVDPKGLERFVASARSSRDTASESTEVIAASRAKIGGLIDDIRSVVEAYPQASLTKEALEARQLVILNRFIRFARENSEFWRTRLPDSLVRRPDDVSALPFTTKTDILEHHTKPLLRMLAEGVPATRIKTPMMTVPLAGCDIWRTSGSSSIPTVLVALPEEFRAISELFGSKLAAWFGPNDRVANLYYPGGAWTGFATTIQALNKAGVVAEHIGNKVTNEFIIDEFAKYRFTGVAASPSWFAEFLTWAEKSGRIGEIAPIEKFISGAEPPTSFVEQAGKKVRLPEYLAAKWGTKLISKYAGTEIGLVGLPLNEATREKLQHNPVDDAGYIELVGDDGRPVPVGGTGELVATCFNIMTVPLIRFRSGDLLTLVSEVDSNGAGIRTMKFSDHGTRKDDCITIGADNIYGVGRIPDALTTRFNKTFQMVLKIDPAAAEGLAIEMRSDAELSQQEQAVADAFIRQDLLDLYGLDGTMRGTIETIPITFGVGLEYGSTGKLRKVVNRRA